MKKFAFAAPIILALAACGGSSSGGGGGTTDFDFGTATVVPGTPNEVTFEGDVVVTFDVSDDGMGALSASSSPIPLPVTPSAGTGNATMTGQYAYERGVSGGGVVTYTEGSGPITLTADFDGGTLTGSDGTINVNGAISGTGLSGDVTIAGTTADLIGAVDADFAVGTFAGGDPAGDSLIAGAFGASK